MGKFLGSLFGGGGGTQKAKAAAAPASKALFSPEAVAKATKDYSTAGTAKWNQILSNMGAGGGTGGDLAGAISSQADAMGKALGGLTTESGYGSDPSSQMQNILKSVEQGINPKYSVYG
jgi:hypothetical protein